MEKAVSASLKLLSERLRLARWQAELSQEAVAYKAGVTHRHYTDLETGRRNPTLETIVRVATALDVSLGLLLDPEPSQTAKDLRALKKANPQPLRPGRKPKKST